MECTVEQAPAKLNLGLKILGRRADGYHDLLSVFQAVDLCDRLVFMPALQGKTEVLCSNPELPAGPGNLVYRAVDVLRQATGVDHGIRVVLNKQIPVGAGLGGGSSDAAAVLRALNRMWALGLAPGRLETLAAELGSDVPFFLTRGAAVVTGRGERIRSVRLVGDFWYVLIYPGFEVSSSWAYHNVKFGLTESSIYIRFLNSVAESEQICAGELFECLENDFLPLLKATYPKVVQILETLKAAGAKACSLSGSGSTLYGVFEDVRQASAAVALLHTRGRGVYLCRPEMMGRVL